MGQKKMAWSSVSWPKSQENGSIEWFSKQFNTLRQELQDDLYKLKLVEETCKTIYTFFINSLVYN